MNKLLAVSSSPSITTSYSRQLVQLFRDSYQENIADAQVTVRDLGENPPPHLDETVIGAFFTPPDQRTDSQNSALAFSDTLVDELEAADIIVIGAPMHNFSIASSLKAYLDHIVRAGRTFRYTEQGPEGLLTGKKVFVLTARGGNYSAPPMDALDHQAPYLKTILGFIGLDDVTFIHAQGMAMGDEVREQSLAAAKKSIAASIGLLTDSPRAATA